jgi:Tol biopolymer transport system component
MTFKHNIERHLPDLLSELSDGPMPDYRDDIVRRAAQVRQRPAWTFPERWLPMAIVTRRTVAPNVPWRLIAVAALLLVLAVAALALNAGVQRRVPPPFGAAVNGQFAYQSGDDILVRESIDGPDRILVGGAGIDAAPIWSRQGDRLLFVRDLGTPNETLMIASSAGGDVRRISDPIAGLTALAWSPSGTMIAASSEPGGLPVVTIVQADGSGSKQLDLGMPATFVFWRPGTTDQLLFRGEGVDGRGLYLVNSDGSGLHRLDIAGGGLDGGQYDFLDPAWSNDGLRLAFHQLDPVPASPDGNGFRIHVVDVDRSGNVSRAHSLEYSAESDDELQAHWTPLDDGIVFQRREGTVDTLHVGTPDGNPTRDLTGQSTGGGVRFEVSPDGRFVVALYVAEGTLWRDDLTSGTATRIETTNLREFPSWQRLAP